MNRIVATLLLAFSAFAAADQLYTCSVPSTPAAYTCTPSAPPSCPPPQPAPVTQSCPPGQIGSITTSYSCVGTSWTPNTVNTCTASPPPQNVHIIPAPPVGGTGQLFTAQPKQWYAWVLPITTGSVAISIGPGSPDFSIKSVLSAVAGDETTAAAMPLTQTVGFGIPPNKIVHPYYALQGSESAGLTWTNVDAGRGVAVVAPGWYFSFQSQASVPVMFYMQIPQQ